MLPAFHFHSVLLIFVYLWPISTFCVADMDMLWPIWFVADMVCGRYSCGRYGLWPISSFPLPYSPSSDLSGYSIKCFFQIYKSKVELLSFTPIFLLYLPYCEDCICSSFPWHKSKLHCINLYLLSDPSFEHTFYHFQLKEASQ